MNNLSLSMSFSSHIHDCMITICLSTQERCQIRMNNIYIIKTPTKMFQQHTYPVHIIIT